MKTVNNVKLVKLTALSLTAIVLLAIGFSLKGSFPVQADSTNSDVSLSISSALTLSLTNCDGTNNSTLKLEVYPTPTGTFKSNCQTVKVATNAPGYALTAKASSLTLNYLNPTTVSPTPSIAPTTSLAASPTTLSTNTWGFAAENRLGFNSSYTVDNKANTYAQLPISDTTIYQTDVFPLPVTDHKFFYGVNIASDTLAGTYGTTVTYTAVAEAVPEPPKPEEFKFTVDTRLTSTGATTGTATTFAIPTSGYVGGASNHAYNWQVNCDTTNNPNDFTNYTGTSSTDSAGIACNYNTPGQYQITIRSNGEAIDGWMNAFGFYNNTSGANANANKYLVKSLDTPIPTNAKTKGSSYRFAYMFFGAYNAASIPADLFSQTSTAGDTNLSQMFYYTFSSYARNSTSATIPSGLFDSINTTNATDLSSMFSYTFNSYAYNSTSGAIPAGLFSSINTTNAISLNYMFRYAFQSYARNSTSGTIPAGLFSSINTTNAINTKGMFERTFAFYAYNSTSGTIPAGLFSSINTANATSLSFMFDNTFYYYAYNSTSGTIPDRLFDSITINTRVTDLSAMFRSVFDNYAHNNTSATIPDNLFDSINTTNATNLNAMFNGTFRNYAFNSTSATIPDNLFDSIDITSATNLTSMFSNTFNSYAYLNKGGTYSTDINAIWGNANFAGKVTADNAGSSSGVFYQTFYNMPSLKGTAQTFINNKLGGIVPTSSAGTFSGTSVSDLYNLDVNWIF